MGSRRIILGCLVLPLLFLASCATGASRTAVRSPTPGHLPCNYATQWKPPADNIQLNDLAMVSPGEGWAVGNTAPDPKEANAPVAAGVIYHFTDGRWVRLPQTYPAAPLVALSMDSPTDGWAFSLPATAPTSKVLVLHYSFGQWRPVDIPELNGVLGGAPPSSLSVQMFGQSAGWMFAWTDIPSDPSKPNSRSHGIILRYEDGIWRPIAAPPVDITTEVFALSAVSADEAWIVGTDYSNGGGLTTVFAHYINGAWSLWPKTFAGNSDQKITMLSPSDGWATYTANNTNQTVLLHYDGTAWAQVATPPQWTSHGVQISSAAFAISPDVIWFRAYAPSLGDGSSLLEQYVNGQWQQVAWPFSTVTPLAIVKGSGSELWGVGDIVHEEGCAPLGVAEVEQGVFLQLQQGHWTEQVLP